MSGYVLHPILSVQGTEKSHQPKNKLDVQQAMLRKKIGKNCIEMSQVAPGCLPVLSYYLQMHLAAQSIF